MKKNRKVTLYSNEISSERIEEARQYLLDENGEEPTENEVWDFLYEDDGDEWDFFKYNYKEYFDTHNFVVKASLGRWNGRFDSGKILTGGWYDFCGIIQDYDTLEIIDNNGHLEVVGRHHDGTDYFEIRELTRKGDEYANDFHYNKSEFEDAQAVWNNFHSRLPRLAAEARA